MTWRGKVDYLQVPVKVDAILEYRLVGPADTAPTPSAGYKIDPEPVEVAGAPGKFWVEFRVILK